MPYAASLVDWVHWFAVFALMAALIAAALSDITTYLIPHRYSAAIAIPFLVFAIGRPLPFLLGGLAAATLLFPLLPPPFPPPLLVPPPVHLPSAPPLFAP